MGFPAERILPFPYIYTEDATSPDNASNVSLSPAVVLPVVYPFDLRRSILAGEHVMLSPDLQLGKTRTASLTRDHRRAVQETFQFFVDEANELHRRGFTVHGSFLKNCPVNDLLLVMPFGIGGSFDAVGAWIRLNAKYFYCFCCRADYEASWKRPAPADLLDLRKVEPAASLRVRANDVTLSASSRRDAVKELNDVHHLNPETTPWDSYAAVNMEGKVSVVPDAFHNGELGPNKLTIYGSKLLCEDACAVEGRDHSVSAAAALLDDFISGFSRHNTGYHVLPSVRDFSAVKVYSGMMVRSLLFGILAALCSIEDLFNDVRQTALVNVFTGQTLLMRFCNARRWTSSTPDDVDDLYSFIAENWDEALGDFVDWERVKLHLTAHWRHLYLELGAPVHWSTQHCIEALQRIIKAAWRRTSKVNAAEQVLRRIAVLRYIKAVLLPMYGVFADPVSALVPDRETQAYLRGSVKGVAGITALFDNPTPGAETTANTRLRAALRDTGLVPVQHTIASSRMYWRRSALMSRKGICAVSVPAFPTGAREDEAVHAMFSLFADDAGGGAAGVAAAGVPVESRAEFFFVEGWISYDISGLSVVAPNAPVSGVRLTQDEQSSERCVDLAVGRRGSVIPLSAESQLARDRNAAKKVFQRVKLSPKREIVDIANLCQPLLVYPYLGSVADAKTHFRHTGAGSASKWDVEQWLVCPKLY
jgi:hypothetical protein